MAKKLVEVFTVTNSSSASWQFKDENWISGYLGSTKGIYQGNLQRRLKAFLGHLLLNFLQQSDVV